MEDDSFIKITPIESCEEYTRETLHQHDYYELIWFTEVEKSDSMQIDFGEYPISNNTFYFISAGQLHRIDRTGKRGLVIALSRNFFHSIVPIELYSRSTYAINSIINQEKCWMCVTVVNLITIEYNGLCRYPLLEAYFKALFIHMGPIFFKNQSCNEGKKKVSELMDLIEDNFIEHKEVAFYAKHISLSEKAANELSKRILGKTIKSLIQERVLLEMKREIVSNNLSIKEICSKLGFNEASYFTRFFKTHTGKTPEEYRVYYHSFMEEK